jgi:hypothetical protein
MGLFNWFRKDKKKAINPEIVAVERDDKGRWVEIKVVPATVSGKADSIPKIEVVPTPAKKAPAKAPAKKPAAKSSEKKEAIKKDIADTPVAKAKPKPKAKPKTTPKKK